MFWVHDKFGNGLDDPDGLGRPENPNRLGRPDDPNKPDGPYLMWPTKPNCTFKPKAKPIKRPTYKINDEEDSKGPPIRSSQIEWASHIIQMG